jgi:predicted nuclease of predicted toxin-antitoxin system
MRWLADECVSKGIVDRLRHAGHDVVYMAQIAASESDEAVLVRANEEQRLLLTEDKDFGELIFRGGMTLPGIVLLRIDSTRSGLKWLRLATALETMGDRLIGRYTVIDETRFRSRPLIRLVR